MRVEEIPSRFFPNAGEKFDQFEVLQALGEGTFGLVLKVRSLTDRHVYAIKVQKLWTAVNKEERTKISDRFLGEYRCGKIESPYLVHAISRGSVCGNPFIVMEFMEGGDLKSRMKEFYAIEAADRLAFQILMGLRDLHANGIIHRDLKPENVMLDGEMNIRLTDFGIAGFLNARLTVPNFFNGKVRETFGTYAYIAPEQLEDSKKFHTTSNKTDVFSFGVLMFEVLSGGELPFGALSNHAELAEYIKNAGMNRKRNLSDFRKNIPVYWLKILEGCLESNFEKRIAGVNEILNMLPQGQNAPVPTPARIAYDFYKDELSLVVTQGDETGRAYSLTRRLPAQSTGIIRLGWYNPELPDRNHIEIVEKSTAFVSNYHATIERHWQQQRWFIRDGQYRVHEGKWDWYHSTNGVEVNAKRINSNGYEILPGDIITIGDTRLKLIVNQPESSFTTSYD